MRPDLESADAITIAFASGIYDLSAIKRAAYCFSHKASVEIVPVSDGFECRLSPLKIISAVELEALRSDFLIEVLDQDLRLTIAAETEPLRNLILSVAFSKTGLQG